MQQWMHKLSFKCIAAVTHIFYFQFHLLDALKLNLKLPETLKESVAHHHFSKHFLHLWFSSQWART